MKYGEILQRAAQITWRHKVLWVFGIALALFGGGMATGGGNPGSGLQYSLNNPDLQRFGQQMPFGPMDWGAIATGLLAILGILFLVAIFWALLGIIVRYTSIGALIGMTVEIEVSQDTSFRSGLNRGWRRLLQLFLIGLVIGIVNALVAFVLVLLFIAIGFIIIVPAIALFSAEGGWIALGVIWLIFAGLGLLALAILVAIILGGAFTITQEYAYRFAVLHQLGVFDSIGAAVRLLRERPKQSAWIWIVLGLIRFAVNIIVLPIALVIGAAIAIPAFALSAVAQSALLMLLVAIPIVILGILILVAIEGIYLAFSSVTWTLVFLDIHAPNKP